MSAGDVTGAVGSATGTPAAGTASILQGTASSIINRSQNILNNFLPPETRADLKSKLTKFASDRPILSSFLLSQIALSGLPLALFFISAITITIFALISGILVGLIGALLFIIFAIGLALFILLPTLFITTFFAVTIWLGGIVTYYIVKRFNEKNVPGIHVPFVEGVMEQGGLKQVSSLSNGAGKKESDGNHANGTEHRTRDDQNGGKPKSTKNQGHATAGSDESVTHEKHSKKASPDEFPPKLGKPANEAGATVGHVGKHLSG